MAAFTSRTATSSLAPWVRLSPARFGARHSFTSRGGGLTWNRRTKLKHSRGRHNGVPAKLKHSRGRHNGVPAKLKYDTGLALAFDTVAQLLALAWVDAQQQLHIVGQPGTGRCAASGVTIIGDG